MTGLDGIEPELAFYVRQAAQIISDQAPGLSLRVVSGYRSPKRQAQLLASWNAGDRRGLVAKPAVRSAHSEGRAVDLGWVWNGRGIAVSDVPIEYWDFLASLFEPVGVRWGGRFRSPDLPHFELTTQRA